MIYIFHKKIDIICLRITAIQKCYNQVNNLNLKFRLYKEYEGLKIKFFKIKLLIKLIINNSSPDKLTISNLLYEKCSRCENEIFKNKFLFSA